jgi:hypothetical protein
LTEDRNYVERVLLQRSLLAYLPPDLGMRKTGKKRFRGQCPFTRGSANAFEVYWSKAGYFKFNCFSCGEFGNVINFVARFEKITIKKAIGRLVKGTDVISDEAMMQRAFDQMIEAQGIAVLACNAPDCLSEPLELANDIEVALALAEAGHAGNWFVAPDGVGSLCPEHA